MHIPCAISSAFGANETSVPSRAWQTALPC